MFRFEAEPEDYQKRVERHLKEHRPQEHARRKKDGSLKDYVDDLGESIANWVNSQLPSEDSLEGLDNMERLRQLQEARMFAESDAMREYLPRDEGTEKEIGPNGGYVDRMTTISDPEEVWDFPHLLENERERILSRSK